MEIVKTTRHLLRDVIKDMVVGERFDINDFTYITKNTNGAIELHLLSNENYEGDWSLMTTTSIDFNEKLNDNAIKVNELKYVALVQLIKFFTKNKETEVAIEKEDAEHKLIDEVNEQKKFFKNK